jgi:chaperone required for assembly of F1-ATPase
MALKRSYREVSVDCAASPGQASYRVLLDGKPARTPNGAVLALPSRSLAEAIAEEWRTQDKIIRPQTIILTRLANTAIDRVVPDLQNARQQIMAIANSDVICYRAETPSDLVRRQQLVWDPLLVWCAERFGASLRTASGVAYIEQDEVAIQTLHAQLTGRDAFFLAALYAASALCGSLVIALAIADRKLDSDAAHNAASLDKIYQAERWGWDERERAKVAGERAELNQISRFLDLLER